MKVLRGLFYVMAILTFCEVMELRLLHQQDSVACFSSDLEEPPMEEDESRELEDGDDLFYPLPTYAISIVSSTLTITPSLYFDLREPLHEIILPPPQG